MDGALHGALAGVHHVKLPVSDVVRSRDWYGRVLGLRTVLEFVEEGTLMGVALGDPAGSLQLALRQDPARVTAWAGFDPVALRVPTATDLRAWLARMDELGEPHGGIVTGHVGHVLVGLRDPDGVEIRLYADAEGEDDR
jgi:catechol 2,3-dioxygenase-like lactoylglutathione lyase family enzyme